MLCLHAVHRHKWSEDVAFDDKIWRIADNDLQEGHTDKKKAEEASRLYMSSTREKMVYSLSHRLTGKSIAEIRDLLGPENQTMRVNPSELTYALGPNLIDTNFITIEFKDGIYHDYFLWTD